MSQSSFYVVGGKLVENYLDGHDELPDGKMPRITGRQKPTLNDQVIGQGASALNYVMSGDSSGYSAQRAAQGIGRARRAKLMFTIAATLAYADGPLPFGDGVAIVVLAGYGIYEGYKAVEDIVQYD
jgi:hypothetical protein